MAPDIDHFGSDKHIDFKSHLGAILGSILKLSWMCFFMLFFLLSDNFKVVFKAMSHVVYVLYQVREELT